MGVRQRLADWISPPRASSQLGSLVSVEEQALPADWKATPQINPQALSRSVGLQSPGQPVYTDMTVRKAVREGYKINVYVYRSVRAIVQACSGIPWIAKDASGKPINGHPFELLMKRPNREMSGQDVVELLVAHLLLPGNALWQPMIVNGKPAEIWPIMPDLVQPIPAKTKGQWLEGWKVTDTSGVQTQVPPETFIHFMQFDPSNPYWGIGPLMAAARTVDTDNEAQDTQKISMQNRGTPDGVFVHEATMTDEQFAEANRRIGELYTNKTKRRAPWVLGGGSRWEQMSLTPVEMDFIASRLANLQAIATAFSLDPWWLGDRSHSTYNNVGEARRALYEDAAIPLLDDIKATLNLKLAHYYGENIELTYDLSGVAAMRDDFGKKSEQAGRLWSMGVPFQQINDKLELGFQQFDGWDVSYLPMSVVPSDVAGQEPELPEEKPEQEPSEEGTEDGKEPQPSKSLKSVNLTTEEQKTAHWKRVDIRRTAYWNVVAKRVQRLYGAEADAVVRAVQNAPKEDAKNQAEAAIRSVQPQWERSLAAILTALVEDFGQATAQDLGAKPKSQPASLSHKDDSGSWVFDVFSSAARAWIKKHAAESVTTICQTDVKELNRVIEKGWAENWTIDEIGREIRKFYDDRSPSKAMTVARTEVGAAASEGQMEAARQSGIVQTKTWVSSRDDRVRDSHETLDGETVPLEENFSNGCEAPGVGPDADEVVMCRCAMAFNTRYSE